MGYNIYNMERKCQYINCDNELVNKRIDAKFCSRDCKSNNRKMNKYWVDRKEQGMKEDMKKIEDYKILMNIIQREE